ncbi:MAG: MFS transporter [Bdellovibrionales bacterium]|nr:MFS transporter [Bdellovibrionales bacterium]
MKSDSLLAPLAEKPFSVIWTATFLSNIGTWMHDVT